MTTTTTTQQVTYCDGCDELTTCTLVALDPEIAAESDTDDQGPLSLCPDCI